MTEFQQYLEQELKEIVREIPLDFIEKATRTLDGFFTQFASAEHSKVAMQAFEYSMGAQLEIDLGIPLTFLLTGTGEHGPGASGFIVDSPTSNVLSWVENGTRRFASSVYNPGQEAQFSEQDMVDAITDAYVSEED